nr:hypothetical protein BaRGS_000660 [Batillaria attramentaria]
MPYMQPAPPTRTQATKPQSWTSRMVLSPSMHNKLMAQAKQSGLTRHYEEHGCIDPVMYMPPGSTTMGLAMGCSNPMSQQLCQMVGRRVPGAAAGKSNNMAMMMMFAPPHMKQLMETCLSRTTLTKAMFGMARGGRGGGGGMDPAAMAMIMGGAGGVGGGGMMSAMMMMNMMGNRNQQSPVSTSTSSSQGSLPAGAALPGGGPQPTRQGGYAAQRQSPPQSMSSKCASILPFVMMQGGEGGLMTPEGGDIVRDLRRQMFPYTCQEVGAGMMPVRMCCPGKGNYVIALLLRVIRC